jgi:prepilin-type N-terminal cleavage/methylation domain-containing protein
MKRSGFTMIELIFVIVILGILAAVAIPRLAATRDDAKISKGASEASTALTDIGAYFTSKGMFAKPVDMTNVPINGTAEMNTTQNYPMTAYPCIKFESVASITGGTMDTINLQYVNSTDTICKGVAIAAHDLFGQAAGWTAGADVNKTHKFGGTNVTF